VEGAGSGGPRTDPGPEDAADFGALPDFELLDQRGRTVTLAALRGHPLVLGALFSSCTGPCPSIARGLERLQDELSGTDVRIVVVSVDPEVDTPAVLARYAQVHGADPERWLFLTGAQAAAHALVREGFFMAVQAAEGSAVAPGERVTHDTRLLAVDRRGHRRGWYLGTDEVQLEKLRRRMLFLTSETPEPLAGAPR
jgi:cytochrome oxidase Cu insertion factor (SCO1/SenC/PrrC family)